MGTAPSQGLRSSPQLAEGPWARTRPSPVHQCSALFRLRYRCVPSTADPETGLSTSLAAPSQSLGLALLLPEPPHSAESFLSPIWAGSLVVSSSVGAQVLSLCGPRANPHLLDPPLSSKPLSPTLSSTPPLGCPNLHPGPHSPGLCGCLQLDSRGTALKPQGVLHAAARGAPLCLAGWGLPTLSR